MNRVSASGAIFLQQSQIRCLQEKKNAARQTPIKLTCSLIFKISFDLLSKSFGFFTTSIYAYNTCLILIDVLLQKKFIPWGGGGAGWGFLFWGPPGRMVNI